MRVEEAVGRRIATLRDRAGMSQTQLGEHLGELLGTPWPRQTVSMAEKGGRKLTAAELYSISFVLGVHVGQLFVPPPELDVLEFPSGTQVDSTRLRGPSSSEPVDAKALVAAAFFEIGKVIRAIEKQVGHSRAAVDELRTTHSKLANSMGMDAATEEADESS